MEVAALVCAQALATVYSNELHPNVFSCYGTWQLSYVVLRLRH